MPENKKPWEVNYTEEDKKPWEQDYNVDTLKKKEETTERDYSALSEQLGKRFEDAGSTMQTTKSQEDLKAKKKRVQPELYRLAEESPEKFSSDEGREGVRTALLKQGYTSSEADIESKRVQNLAIEKPIKDNSNRAKSYLKYVSGYGKDASIAKVANASDNEIEEWTSQMLDKGISQQGIDRAIYDYGNKYREIKGREKGEEYDSSIQATAWDRARQASESGAPTTEEVEVEKRAMIESDLRSYLPEDLKIQEGIESKISAILEELKTKKIAGTLTNAERDSYEAKLVGLEKLRNSSDLPDRLFNPATGKMVDRKDASSEALDYEDAVISFGDKLTDKEKTFDNAKKALHRFEAMDDLYNTEVTFTMRDGRVITAPYSEIDSRYADMFDDDSESGRRIAEAKGIKNNWLKAKAQFEAVNRAYMTNTDPAQVDKGYWSSLAEKSIEAFDSGELTTDTDIKFVNEYTSLMDDLGSYATPEQREAAKVTFKEKLADATVQSAAIGRDIAISALVTRNAGTLLGVGSKLGKLKNLMTNKWGKTGKHIFNISEEIVRGGVTFAPTDASFAEGAGEGLAQGSITAIMGKRGQALGRLAELGIRVAGGTATEVVQEYSGQLVNELTTAGVDVDEAFKRTFGRNIEDATDKLLLTATMSAMFSTAFNANVLFKTRETLQSELDKGNVPEEKIDDVESILKETAPKETKSIEPEQVKVPKESPIESEPKTSVVKEEIKPIEDVPTKEEIKEEKEVAPTEDVESVEATTEQAARGDGDTDTKQGEVVKNDDSNKPERVKSKEIDVTGEKLEKIQNDIDIEEDKIIEKYVNELGLTEEEALEKYMIEPIPESATKLNELHNTRTDIENNTSKHFTNKVVGKAKELGLSDESIEVLKSHLYLSKETGALQDGFTFEEMAEQLTSVPKLKSLAKKLAIAELKKQGLDPEGVLGEESGWSKTKKENFLKDMARKARAIKDEFFRLDLDSETKTDTKKLETSAVKEEIKPIEDVPTKEEIKEEKEVAPTEDVKPVEPIEAATEQAARSVEQPGTEQEEVLEALPKDATVEEKRKYAIDMVLSGQVNKRNTGKNIAVHAREDFNMPTKDINKAITDIKKGNTETAPAKRLIGKLIEAQEKGGIPVIEGIGGKSVRSQEIPIEYFKEGIDEYNRKREYTDSELKEINDIQDELVKDHDSHFESLTEEEQIEKLEYYERINKREVSEDTKGTESKSDVVSKTERSSKETAKTKAELIAEANNLKEGEDTRKIMKKAKAAGLSKDSDLIDIISPKAKAYRESQEKLQKATRDALGIDEEFNYGNVFLNEDITDKIEEWKGEKLPSGTLKKSILEVNKTGDVSKGLDIMKNTDWYKDQSEEKQYEFEYDYKKSLGEDMTGVEKPTAKREFVRKTERSIIKEKINALKQGIKEGRRVEAKDLKDMRSSLDRYIKETLKGFNLSKASSGKMKTLIKNVNRKNYDSLIDKVDREFKKLESEDKAKTISDIHKFLTSPKTILGKKGKRKVGKVPIEIQQYLKAFDTSNLNDMTRDEVKQIYADLKAVVNEGKKKTKAIERAINAQKRREQGTNFLEFHRTNQGESYTVSGKQNIIDELSNKNRVAIINGQLISSKTKFDESEKEVLERSEEISSLDDFNNFLEDNPNFELDNVTILKTQSQKSAQHNRKKGIGVVFSKYFNPIYRTANLRLNLQPLDKGSKILRENSDNMAKNAVKSEVELNIESNKKKKQLVDGLEKIYKKYNPKFLGVKTKIGVKTRAKARLSEETDVDISNDVEPFTNSNLIDIYLMSKNPEGKEKLISQEFDIEAINKYMEDNPDLKEYSEFLSDWYNTIAKESYTDIHEKVTKTKFPEGKYYPMYTNKTFNALDESGGIMDDNLNVNPMKAFAGSMVSRVKNKADLDVYIGAFEKANHYINTMERVKQFDEFSEDVSNTFNKATNSEIIKKVGIEKFNNMIDHLSIVITGKDPNSKGVGDGFVNTLMGIKIFGSLGFKTASIPTQLMSFTHFMQSAEVPAKEWIKGFAPVTKGERQAAKAFATSDYVKNRFEGGNIDREYNRFLKGGKPLKELLKSTTKLSMLAIRMGDISAVISGGSALSVAIYRREIKAGKSHGQAIKTAVEEASVESETAQQSSLPSQTSKMQRDPVGRLFTAFKTSQIAAKNKMILSAKTLLSDSDLTPKEKTHHISNMLYFAGASVTFAVAKRGFQLAALKSLLMLAKGAMSEEDEKELKRAGYDTLMDNTGSMLDGFGYEGFLLNVLLNKLKGDEWKNAIPLMQQILDIAEGGASGIKFLTDVYANGKEWDDLSDFEKSEIHRLFAASGIIKQFDSWKETVKGEKDFFDAFMNQPTKEKKEKYKKNQNDWLWNQMEGKADKKKKNRKNKRSKRSRR